MAITILLQPTTPNASNTNLVYAVSSTNTAQPQFQYVMDVYENGGATRLARIKQYPNPEAKGVFDVSSILNDYMDYDFSPASTGSLAYSNAINEFDIKFGEEYGTSPTSTTTIFPNLATDSLRVFQAVVDPNEQSDINPWMTSNTSIYTTGYNWPDTTGYGLLSNKPTTIPVWEKAFNVMGAYDFTGTTGNIRVNDSDGALDSWSITDDIGSVWFRGTVPNIRNIEWLEFQMDPGGAGATASKRFNVEQCINYELITFCFINFYGVWDNYTLDVPVNVTTDIERQQYEQPFVNYSTGGTYNQKRGGTINYRTNVDDTLSLTTPPLNNEEAAWVQELIESPKVYVLRGNIQTNVGYENSDEIKFLPAVITNTNVQQNTNLRGQKLFQYDISFKYSNSRRGR